MIQLAAAAATAAAAAAAGDGKEMRRCSCVGRASGDGGRCLKKTFSIYEKRLIKKTHVLSVHSLADLQKRPAKEPC